MVIREAKKEDLPRILELGVEFNHLMIYQKDPMMMEQYLDRILVAEEEIPMGILREGVVHEVPPSKITTVGYYHYIVSGDPGFEEMLRCYRQFPESLIEEAEDFRKFKPYSMRELCICMQGASHREVFAEFIKYFQARYYHIWNYCSIKSQRVNTYKEMGFAYDPKEQYTFFNVSKGDVSTYQLGRWVKDA